MTGREAAWCRPGMSQHSLRFGIVGQIACTCGQGFGSRKKEAARHLRYQPLRDAIEARRAARQATWDGIRESRLRDLDSTPRPRRYFAALWGVSRKHADHYLWTMESRGLVQKLGLGWIRRIE